MTASPNTHMTRHAVFISDLRAEITHGRGGVPSRSDAPRSVNPDSRPSLTNPGRAKKSRVTDRKCHHPRTTIAPPRAFELDVLRRPPARSKRHGPFVERSMHKRP